jgi:hypothetical protein
MLVINSIRRVSPFILLLIYISLVIGAIFFIFLNTSSPSIMQFVLAIALVSILSLFLLIRERVLVDEHITIENYLSKIKLVQKMPTNTLKKIHLRKWYGGIGSGKRLNVYIYLIGTQKTLKLNATFYENEEMKRLINTLRSNNSLIECNQEIKSYYTL